jgi:hypothetical protein
LLEPKTLASIAVLMQLPALKEQHRPGHVVPMATAVRMVMATVVVAVATAVVEMAAAAVAVATAVMVAAVVAAMEVAATAVAATAVAMDINLYNKYYKPCIKSSYITAGQIHLKK